MIRAAFFLAMMVGSTPAWEPIDHPLHLSNEAKRFFEERVDRGAPPLRRLEMLLEVVFSESGLDFRYAEETKTADGIFRSGSGNCLSFTSFLVAMGRHFGLDVRYREVEVAPSWSRQGELVVFNRHVNAIVMVGPQAYVVDLLPEVNRVEIRGHVVADERGFAHFFNNLGADWLGKGSPTTAMTYFRHALDLDSDASFVWANQGVVQAGLGLHLEAESSYRRAIKLDRQNMVALSNLAELYLRTGRRQEGEELRARVESFRKKNPYYHYGLGIRAYEEGRINESIEHLRAALKRRDKEYRFHHALANAYVELGDLAEASRSLRKARELAPEGMGGLYSQKLESLSAHRP
jgi:tetratricopeptide (TPR) repeat protein